MGKRVPGVNNLKEMNQKIIFELHERGKIKLEGLAKANFKTITRRDVDRNEKMKTIVRRCSHHLHRKLENIYTENKNSASFQELNKHINPWYLFT